jgi:spore germination protein YaaH
VLGLPLYGYDWPSSGKAIPGTATADAEARTVVEAWALAADHDGGGWDDPSSKPYLIYQDGGWRQLWFETPESLGAKLDYAAAAGLGGVGFWALTYDGGAAEIWDRVAAYKAGADDDAGGPLDADDDEATASGCGC